MQKDTCSKCNAHKGTTKQRYCLKCKSEYMRQWRKSHPLSDSQRFKAIVRAKLKMRIKRGKIKRMPCEICQSLPVEAHHDDYSKPYDVRWLCRKHHVEHHYKEKQTA